MHYTPHVGATLSINGKELAEELEKKHRAITDFLYLIGISSSIAGTDACQIEHHVSPETVRRLELLTGTIRVRLFRRGLKGLEKGGAVNSSHSE